MLLPVRMRVEIYEQNSRRKKINVESTGFKVLFYQLEQQIRECKNYIWWNARKKRRNIIRGAVVFFLKVKELLDLMHSASYPLVENEANKEMKNEMFSFCYLATYFFHLLNFLFGGWNCSRQKKVERKINFQSERTNKSKCYFFNENFIRIRLLCTGALWNSIIYINLFQATFLLDQKCDLFFILFFIHPLIGETRWKPNMSWFAQSKWRFRNKLSWLSLI